MQLFDTKFTSLYALLNNVTIWDSKQLTGES